MDWCSSYHEDAPVAVPVDAPQFEIGLGLDSSSSRSAVDQGQFSKTASFSDAGHPLPVDVHLQTEQDGESVTIGLLCKLMKKAKHCGANKRLLNMASHPHASSAFLGLFDMFAKLV